ncbi:MAG TPA: hypothetical protein VFE32_06110 [Puia sp.]|jgi:hypothetical protein|nr:hypothetical protein [Puia sp.]
MRNKVSLLLSALAVITGGLLLLPGCLKDRVTARYKIMSPVYSLRSTVLANVNGDPGTAISQPGQIYVKGSYIFLNDIDRGIHVIDNSNPSNPVQTAFLNIPGNLNIGIRNNILYADMYTDVLSIDISNIHQVKIIGLLRSFFTTRNFSTDSNYVVANWILKDTSIAVVPQGYTVIPNTNYITYPNAAPLYEEFAAASSSGSQSGTGTAGSEAVMTLVGNYLYAIPEQHSLGVINIADSTKPKQTQLGMAGFDLETIFPIQNKLLVGSKEGVYVFSLSDPANPAQVGEFTHGTACDPVIANSNFAYLTLHTGTYCGAASNELDILNAKDISNATLIQSYPMTSPTGLCLDGSLLFVCDQSVVKVFDVSSPTNLQLLSSVPVNSPSDVIATDHVMMVVAADGLHQFDYTDPSHVTKLSYLALNNSKL